MRMKTWVKKKMRIEVKTELRRIDEKIQVGSDEKTTVTE